MNRKGNLKMEHEEILSFMDLLDLDEEMIDSRLNSIMVRTSYTNRHLTSAMQLLQYKQLINLQEGTECGTEEECNFIAKLITDIREDNVEYVCKIITIVLCLNTSSIVSKAEHLIQQIFSDINLPLSHCDGEPNDTDGDVKSSRTLLSFRLCESILDAVIKSNNKISLLFLETPLENVLSSCDDKLKIHFLTRTVQRLVEAVAGYNILDRIWNYLKLSNVNRENALKTLSCLSEFYLPVPDSKGNVKFESEIVLQYEFWSLLLYGMMSNDLSVRKLSVYLTKRGIDCVIILKQDLTVNSEDYPIFTWEHKSEKSLKEAWDHFFVLTDSLEEKQSNIVLPSLQLFESIHLIPHCWLNCAFNIGLKHDNTQVRCKCIEYRLNAAVTSETDALILLEALNDINIYDNENELLKQKLSKSFEHIHTFINVFRVIAKVKWSPIPFYHLTNVLCDIKLENISYTMKQGEIIQIITDILKVHCNNIAIRKAVHVNISFFVGKCFKNLHWKDFVNIYLAFKVDILNTSSNPLVLLVEHLSLNEYEKTEFFQCIGNSYQMLDLIILYLSKHEDDHKVILNIITEKIGKIQDIVNRQYSNKVTCLNDIIFLIHLFSKTAKADGGFKETINTMIGREYKIILQYVTCLLSSDTNLNIEEIYVIFKEFSPISSLNDSEVKETLLQLYKSALLLLNDNNTELDKKVVSIYVYNNLSNNPILVKEYKHEMLSLKHFLEIMKKTEFNVNICLESTGRLRNVFYEKSCEIVHCILKEQKEIKRNMKELINFIETVIECGGYGCLKWILRIMNDVLPLVLNDSEIDFNVAQFIKRMWKEIEELKSNNQYFPCIEEFVNLITQVDLLNQPTYNNIVMCYSNKILEYGPLKNTPLFCLVKKLNSMNTTVEYSQIVYAICEILLYSPVPRKDQRIMDNLSVEILHNPKYCLNMTEINIHFNFEIQYLSISTLSNIVNQEMIETITSCIINKINDNFKNKQRYHGNSQPHRLLLTGLQHLLLLNLLNLKSAEDEKTIQWVIELLGKLPHQPSVRICLEWYIALHIYLKKINLNEDLLKLMKSKNVPLTSQFIIMYWITKHQISNGTCKKDEYEFVMDTLLSHTMGQMFNIRLHAQYLATKLNGINLKNSQKYAYTIEVIEKTFIESEKDKNFVKLREDLFINDFDIVSHLTPCFIYYFLPKYCDVGSNETVDETYVRNILRNIQESMNINDFNTDFKVEWTLCHKSDEEIFNYGLRKNLDTDKTAESADMQGTIQKKYIPWKNMSDIDVFEADKKRECSSEFIVVASLIDKLPNLGGMARTSEVFGVKTYVVDSLRHLQDKQFQGLSVSAERWVNIEEVRPGQPLKDYLIKKKAEGYIVVAAEQTSTSCQLQAFKFPKKTLLLLGHEKEGIPCDLLPMMDHCVEIPQQGFVRSLNVHVTAAIFVWEYSRQNIL